MTSVDSYQEEGVWVCGGGRERGRADGVGWGVDVDEGKTAEPLQSTVCPCHYPMQHLWVVSKHQICF